MNYILIRDIFILEYLMMMDLRGWIAFSFFSAGRSIISWSYDFFLKITKIAFSFEIFSKILMMIFKNVFIL